MQGSLYKKAIIVALSLCVFSSCALLAPQGDKLNTLSYKINKGHRQALLVLLPGIGDGAADFDKKGFIEAIKSEGLSIDVIAVDTGLGHYFSDVLIERLRQEVVQPARKEGYQQVWLVGVSLGAMGAMLYARKYSADIDGIIAIAPYLGSNSLVNEIRRSGGLAHWQPGPSLPGDFRPKAWLWLQRQYRHQVQEPRLVLAYGENDQFAEAHKLLARTLPEDQVIRTRGRHDWSTWLHLWKAALRNPLLQAADSNEESISSHPAQPDAPAAPAEASYRGSGNKTAPGDPAGRKRTG